MGAFRIKPVVVVAITFDELVQHGRDTGANIVGDMPWSFSYHGHAVSHENNECYLVNYHNGTTAVTLYVRPQDMLVLHSSGELTVTNTARFHSLYEPV